MPLQHVCWNVRWKCLLLNYTSLVDSRMSFSLCKNTANWLITYGATVRAKSQSQLVWSFESQSRVKVKVVKWCRKKWFDHNQMYIYHKQCEILQKNHRNSSNIQFQWFPIEKGRKLCKRKRWNGWSKSIVLENKVAINFDFRSGAKKSSHLDHPLQGYGPKFVNMPK